MSNSQPLEEIEAEILKIFADCKAQGLSKDEIRDIFSPLGLPSAVDKLGDKVKANVSPRQKFRLIPGILLLLLIFGGVGLISRNEEQSKNLRFHFLAVIRMALIKVLPYWTWTDMYYTRCLVRNPFFEPPSSNLKLEDCNLCESLGEEIPRLDNLSQTSALEEYIRREKPFLVTDAMAEWDIMTTDQFWFDNITEIYLRQDKYSVCNVNTNLRISNGDFTRLLKRLYNPRTQEWFIHWENCQKDMAKGVRSYYRRPYFISDSLDFTGSNWVLMSSEFKGRVYKKLEVSDSLMLVYQVRGFNHVRLSPVSPCRGHCPELVGVLREGEILVVTNLLWIFEYIPGEDGDNLALVSEVSWPSME